MSPSPALPLPSRSSLTDFFEGDRVAGLANGHDTADIVSSPIFDQHKLPRKSNLKRHSKFLGSWQHQQPSQSSMRLCTTFAGHALIDIGATEPPKSLIEDDSSDAGGPYDLVSGHRVCVVVPDEDCCPFKRKDCRVTWTDNQGKDLTEIWEFEPSVSGDSAEESDTDSSQSCACVIQ